LIGIDHATFSFETFDELIWLATSRVPSGSAFGSDHVDTGGVVVDEVDVDCAEDVDCVEDAVVDVDDEDFFLLLPPHAAITTHATTANTTAHTIRNRRALLIDLMLVLR
jgi:hypothetical protein